MILCIIKLKKLSVIKLCMIIIAMILSNSRAGIVSFFVVAGYMIIRYIIQKEKLIIFMLSDSWNFCCI